MTRTPRPKKCRTCRQPFRPANTLQTACSVPCAMQQGRAQLRRSQDMARRAQRRETAQRKVAMRTPRDWVKRAQRSFNAYVRLRDAAQPCISCGRSNAEVASTDGWKPGGAWDCGHFLSVGSHPNLRFEPDNAHKQCKSCNGGSNHYSGKRRTVSAAYREGIIHRIGIERVEALEADEDPRKYRIADLIEIERLYKALARNLERAPACERLPSTT